MARFTVRNQVVSEYSLNPVQQTIRPDVVC